jgi:hypothetical protein
MTPEYVYDNMTWNEVKSGLDFVANFEEPRTAKIFGKKYKGIGKWIFPHRDNFRSDVKKMVSTAKRGING